MLIKINTIASYKGHSVKANGTIDITFSCMYSEITKSIEVLQLLNNDVKIMAKLPATKPTKLGTFNVKSVSFDGDGKSVLKFNSLVEFVEMESINSIISQENFQLRLEADVEMEEEEEDG